MSLIPFFNSLVFATEDSVGCDSGSHRHMEWAEISQLFLVEVVTMSRIKTDDGDLIVLPCQILCSIGLSKQDGMYYVVG